METSTRFSNTEITLVISNAIISKLFLVYPSAFAALGASAGIILALSTVFFGFIFTLVTLKLYKTKTDITELLPRKSLKIIFSIIIIALFTGNQGYFLRSVAESLKISILPDSPLFFITLVYMAGVVICSHTGLKAIVRAHSFATPFTLFVVAVLLFSSINNFDFYNVFPIFGNGTKMLPYIWVLASYFADFVLLLFIMPFSSQKASAEKIIIPTYVISSLALIVIIGIYTLVIPYTASADFFIPVYRIAQYVNYKSFMARMESIFTIGWMLSWFLTSATYLYITSMIAGRMFNAKSYRPFMYGTALVTFIISLIPSNTNKLVEWSNFFAYPRLIAGMIIPITILYFARKKEVKKF